MKDMLKTAPCVFAVEDTYQIFVPVLRESVMWVQIGDTCYYDHSNGILRSAEGVHRMTVPAHALERAGEYTICWREVWERKTGYSETGEVETRTFAFCPVRGETIRAYQIADAHNMVTNPVLAARAFEKENGKIDFLILNGDLTNNSDKIENFQNIYELGGQLTGGNIPIVFSRGNHDTRGVCAEKLADYTPTAAGRTYYTFRLGNIWGLVMDCGEDKPDNREEYGNTICCHTFRREETAYLENLTKRAAQEYGAEGVAHRIVIVHMPFTRKNKPPFDIEEELYTSWAKLLKENIQPEVMICGHTHSLSLDMPGSENDAFGQPCPVVVGSKPNVKEDYFAGSGFVFGKRTIEVTFNDKDAVLEKHTLQL